MKYTIWNEFIVAYSFPIDMHNLNRIVDIGCHNIQEG